MKTINQIQNECIKFSYNTLGINFTYDGKSKDNCLFMNKDQFKDCGEMVEIESIVNNKWFEYKGANGWFYSARWFEDELLFKEDDELFKL